MLIIAALIIGGYTNHAGNVVAGWPVKLTSTQVALAERAPDTQHPTPNTQLPTIPPFHYSTIPPLTTMHSPSFPNLSSGASLLTLDNRAFRLP